MAKRTKKPNIKKARGVASFEHDNTSLLVCAPVDQVSQALADHRGKAERFEDVGGQAVELTEQCFFVFRYKGHDWSIVIGRQVGKQPIHPKDAQALSKALNVKSIHYSVQFEHATGVGYQLYENGLLTEQFATDDGYVPALFGSATRSAEDPVFDDACRFVGQTFKDWGVYEPGLIIQRFVDSNLPLAGDTVDASDDPAIERVDYVALTGNPRPVRNKKDLPRHPDYREHKLDAPIAPKHSPLIEAFFAGGKRKTQFRKLLRDGADPNAPDPVKGESPLEIAVHHGNADAVDALLEAGADPNRGTLNPGVLLFRASGHKDESIAVQLLQAGIKLKKKGKQLDSEPLMLAAFAGQTETVKLLVERGIDVNAKNKEGSTPLMETTLWDKVETAKALVELGADHKLRDREGKTALDLAKASSSPNVAKYLRRLR